SAAEVPVIAPQELAFCGESCEPATVPGLHCPVGKRLCQGRFVDGSYLDRQPLGAAVALQMSGAVPGVPTSCAADPGPSETRPVHLIVDPDVVSTDLQSRRDRREPPGFPRDQPSAVRGYAYLSRQLENFVDVAEHLEAQMLSRYGCVYGDEIA